MWSDGLAKADNAKVQILPFELPVLEEDFFRPIPEQPLELDAGESGNEGPVEIVNRIEELEREAYEKGYKTGEEAGFAMGEQKAIVLIERLQTLVDELSSFREKTVREMEPQFVELAMSAAGQIVIEELTVNQEAVTRITREALSKMLPQQRVTIRTNPFVCDIISKHNPELLGGGGEIVFEADPNAARYGSVIAGPMQEIDTGIDEQLKNMIRQMPERLWQERNK